MNLIKEMCHEDSLPPEWIKYYDEEDKVMIYTYKKGNKNEERCQKTHPKLEYYEGMKFMEDGGFDLIIERDEEMPPTLEEINEMSMTFGITEKDSPYVKEVARLAIGSLAILKEWREIENKLYK